MSSDKIKHMVTTRYDNDNINSLSRYSPDGRGPDIIGTFTKTVILVQCKYHKRRRIGPTSVQKLERLLSNFPNDTIGIIVVPSKNKFNYSAIERVRTSKHNIILTDGRHLYSDLIRFFENHKAQRPLNFNFKLTVVFLSAIMM
ncbi:15933_t:CDS:2, partial [Racocetra persica]